MKTGSPLPKTTGSAIVIYRLVYFMHDKQSHDAPFLLRDVGVSGRSDPP